MGGEDLDEGNYDQNLLCGKELFQYKRKGSSSEDLRDGWLGSREPGSEPSATPVPRDLMRSTRDAHGCMANTHTHK